MKPPSTRQLLVAGLAATLVLAWLAPKSEAPAAPAANSRTADRSKRAHTDAPPPSARGQLTREERQIPSEPVPDIFRSVSWTLPPPPPPPAPPPPPPPPPTAPPLPFAFLGRYAEGSRSLIILSHGDRVLTVAIGEVIENTWRVDSLSGDQLRFVYLPLAMTQTLSTGGTP